MLPSRTSRCEAGSRSNSLGVSVTGSSTVNVKGSYAELLTSSAYDAQGFYVWAEKSGDTSADALFDIAVGGSGSEQILINNLIGPGKGEMCTEFYFPIALPAGSRLSARVQATAASNINRMGVMLVGKSEGVRAYGKVETYGANTADSGGTSIDPGATINTKGAYTQLVASTTYDHHGLILAIGEQNNFVRSACGYRLDLAVGGVGSEQIIVPDFLMAQGAAGDNFFPRSYHFPIRIPAGSRIALRAQCSISDASDRLFDAVLYGVS